MDNLMTFNGDLLRYKSLNDYAAFKDLYDLIKNEKAIKAHLESYQLYITEPLLHDKGIDDALRKQTADGISSALNHFGGLTLISLCTTYEIATREFLSSFFVQNPSHIYEYIGPEDARGHVSLKEVLKVDSYQDLLISLANKSASVASKGKYGQVLSRIASLCKEVVDRKILKELDQLQKKRNMIIHEKYTQTWKLSDVQEAEELISTVIEQICFYGLNNNIPGNYTCIRNDNTLVLQSFAGLTNKDI